MPLTANDIVTDALREIRVLNAADPPSGEDAELALGKLNRLLDNWNADRQAVYADVFTTYTLTPSLNPHTIGPSGATFTATQRPVSIAAANIVLTDVTPNVRVPVTIRDARWWAARSVVDIGTPVPTDLYYEPAWPSGKLWLYPEPTTAYGLELLTRVVLASLALGDTFTMPPGYQDAVTLTLAEDLVNPFAVEIPQLLPLKAQQARSRVFANNGTVPRLITHDAGMPGGCGAPDYHYLTGPLS